MRLLGAIEPGAEQARARRGDLGCETPFRMPPVTYQDENRKKIPKWTSSSKPLFTVQGRWSQITLLSFEDSQLLNSFFRVSEEFRFYTANQQGLQYCQEAGGESDLCQMPSPVAVTTPATVSGSHRKSSVLPKVMTRRAKEREAELLSVAARKEIHFSLSCRPGTHRISLFYYFTIFLLPFLVKLQEWWW